MKKLMIMVAGAILATVTHAAAVGWSLAGANNYAGDAYQFFVIGQNGADSIATITALLDEGTAVDSYAFGSGTIASNGMASQATSGSPYSLDAGTYTAFFVVFDSASPSAGSANYAVVSGATGLTKTVGATSASVTFAGANQATFLNNSSNWSSYGSVPEPTSGLLMLLGVAGLALRRRRA